jgi:hypothetical protein
MRELVINESTRSDTGEPTGRGYSHPEGGLPLPNFVLNYRQGKQPEIVVGDSNESVPCLCPPGQPLPDLVLNFATGRDGRTLASIVSNDGLHSFDTVIAGGGPLKSGGRHSTDSEYGDVSIREAPAEEMSDEDKRRIGLTGNGRPMPEQVLVHRLGPNGRTISEIASL